MWPQDMHQTATCTAGGHLGSCRGASLGLGHSVAIVNTQDCPGLSCTEFPQPPVVCLSPPPSGFGDQGPSYPKPDTWLPQNPQDKLTSLIISFSCCLLPTDPSLPWGNGLGLGEPCSAYTEG